MIKANKQDNTAHNKQISDNFVMTVIILDYFKAKQVLANVKSLLKQQVNFNFKIIVIDNSCDQKNAAMLTALSNYNNIDLVINTSNAGYTKAHNDIKPLIEGEYLMIVNPDIEWSDHGALQIMVDYMDTHDNAAILGPKQIEHKGDIGITIRAFPRFYVQVARRTWIKNLPLLKKIVDYDSMRHLDYGLTQEVDWLQSSCILVRKSFWDEVGGFNENYFLFMSDVELCWNAWKRGYKVVYLPATHVRSDGKRISAGGFRQFFKSWVLRQHVKDSIKFRLKHFFEKNPRIK